MSRREEPGVALLSAGRAARDWKPHKGDRPSAGRSTSTTAGGRETGGEVAAAQGMCGHGALASCRLAELPCLGCKWAGPAK